MIYVAIGLLTLFICFQIIMFVELGQIKSDVSSLGWYANRLRTPDEPAKTPDTPEMTEEPVESVDSYELTESEIARIEREAEFDLRIAQMKDELALRHPGRTENMTDAPVFHPNVQNLPHNIIPDLYDSLPDVEYSR